MNKKLVALLILCLTVLTAFGCSNSKGSSTAGDDKPPVEEHEHSYVWVNELAATCKNVGFRAHYACAGDDCAAVFDENKNDIDVSTLIIPLADHVYYYESDEQTHSKKCRNCDAVSTAAHAYTREIKSEEFLKSAADCYNAAVYYKSCECGKFSNAENAETFTVGEKAGHSFNDQKVCTRCELDMGKIAAQIAAIPEQDSLTLVSIAQIKSAYAEWNKLDEADKQSVENGSRIDALYESVKDIEILDAGLWESDNVHNAVLSFTVGSDNKYGSYAEVTNHTSGWAFMKLAAENKTPSGYVVFYAYNPADTDMVYTYGYHNNAKLDCVLPEGANDPVPFTRHHVTLKAQSWTRVSFKYDMDYPIDEMRLIKGEQAGDYTKLDGLKLTSWYLVEDVNTITNIVCDKTVEYGDLIPEVEADCTKAGVAAHYKVGEKLYNAYKEEVSEAELTIPVKEHNYGEDGVCSDCGDSLVGDINAAVAKLPTVESLSLADVATVKDLFVRYSSLGDSVKALITDSEKLIALNDAVKDIEILSADLWKSDTAHGAVLSFTADSDDKYGAYAEVTNHTSGWAFMYLNVGEVPTGYVVFYAYNPADTDMVYTYGYLNDSKSDHVFSGGNNYHVTLKSKTWTRISFKYDLDYPIWHMRLVKGLQAGDTTSLNGLKFTSWYLVSDENVITDLVSDKSITYTLEEKVAATCESAGVEKHYKGSNGKLYNLYKEEVTEAELTIPATEHSYGADGSCVNPGCTAKLELVDDIDAIPDILTPASVLKIQTLYAQYSALSDEVKQNISNASKLERLYASVSGITVWDSNIEDAKQCGDSKLTITSGEDSVYGKYYEIKHDGGWDNVKSNVAQTPINKYVSFFVYNPTANDVTLTYGTGGNDANNIWSGTTTALRFTLKAGGWTQIVFEWTYVYGVDCNVFCGGEYANAYGDLTGFRISNAFVADTEAELIAIGPNA